MKLSSFVVLALSCSLTYGQNYSIIRRVTNADGYYQPDLVQIPPSSCHNNDGTKECAIMDGKRYSVCQCACDKTDSTHNFYKSTFGFYDGNWRCEKNSALRRRSGCQLSLDHKGLNDPILTVPTTITNGTHFISNVTTKKYISIPGEATCSLKDGNSMYLTCSGKWKELKTALVTKRFNLHLIQNWPDMNVEVEADYSEGSSYPLPSGRIIKLAVTCSDRPWEPSQCILLKIQGRLQCSVSAHLSTTPPAQPLVPIHPTSVPSMTSQSPTTSSSRKPEGNISAPKKDSSITITNGLIIGISLGGVALLAALIILIFFIIRLRKRRFIDNDRKASTCELVLENKMYEDKAGGAQKPTDQMEEQADLEGQRRTTGELTMQEEPLYSLPGSTIKKNNNEFEQDEPFYYALEEPQPHGTQKYDVHEELNPDKEKPHVYGTFNEPHQEATSNDTRGYSNTLYESVGDN